MGKQNRKTKLINCSNCGGEFEKAITEIRRSEKVNGNHFCSLSCSALYRKEINKINLGVSLGNVNRIKKYSNNRKDEYTGLREFIRRAKNRKKLGDLTIDDLKNQWVKQNGICPYSGIKLVLPSTKHSCNIIELASLDRIDSSKLYEKDNVVFVSTPINYMKGCMSEEDTINFCKTITTYWSNKY